MNESNAIQSPTLIAAQIASGLMQALFIFNGTTDKTIQRRHRIDITKLHFHDGSQAPIAWNDIEAIRLHNRFFGTTMQVPMTASEGYNQHPHDGPHTGGFVPGRANHDHRDANNGNFAFAVYHPGTDLPQAPFSA